MDIQLKTPEDFANETAGHNMQFAINFDHKKGIFQAECDTSTVFSILCNVEYILWESLHHLETCCRKNVTKLFLDNKLKFCSFVYAVVL